MNAIKLNARQFSVLKLNLAFALTGAATTLLGSMTPLLEARWRIGDTEAGLLFSAQFLASVCGAAAMGPLARRFGYGRVTIGGLALTAGGMAVCAAAWWPLGLVAVAVSGLGLGFSIPAGNLVMARDGEGARGVVWLNWSWCVGAAGAPALTAWLGMAAWWLGAAGLSICAALLALDATPRPAASVRKTGQSISRAAMVSGVFLFVYVATEQGISGWVASLALRNHATARFWAAAPSIFWAGVLVGRAATPALLKRRLPRSVVYAGLAIASAGAVALVTTRSAALALAAGAVCGVGLAPIYPLVVAQYAAAQRYGREASGMVFAAGGLGGAIGPLVVGYISQMSGSLRGGLALALPATVAMAWLQKEMASSLPGRAKT